MPPSKAKAKLEAPPPDAVARVRAQAVIGAANQLVVVLPLWLGGGRDGFRRLRLLGTGAR